MVKIGQKVKDVLTGFEGTVTGRTEYITGCAQLLVQPAVKGDGEFVEGRWFDETRVEITSSQVLVLGMAPAAKNGPDRPAPIK